MIKWFQNWVKGKAAGESTLFDVAHEVLRPSFFNRELKKQKVKTQIKKFSSFPIMDDASFEMVEEITETVTEACEADPKVNRLFEDS
ncbi:MAG: hypothetical protein HY466_06990 [Deltaproteobacteria bacterium]|nr:hypothetical protein [Deltaproteobacteria bacterium]